MSDQKPKLGDTCTLFIDRLSSGGGRGVGRHHGFVIFVPFAVPGDWVHVQITKVKKSFAEAKILEVHEESSDRKPADCPHFGVCGGCSLQMMTYKSQLEEKEKILKHQVSRIFKDVQFDPITASPLEYRYRNRIQLHQKGDQVGFYKRKTRDLVNITDCLITDSRLCEKIEDLRAQHKMRRFELALTQSQDVVVREGKARAQESLFGQVNAGLNELLVDFVLEEASALPQPHLLFDLYCGEGNFSFPLAQALPKAQIRAVDLSRESIKKANRQNQNDRLKFYDQDVADFLKTPELETPDFILLDPPRSGLSFSVVKELKKSCASNIFYISCDPVTAIRDLKILQETYTLLKVKPFDMFPQTDHMEVFFRLEKKL